MSSGNEVLGSLMVGPIGGGIGDVGGKGGFCGVIGSSGIVGKG